MDKQIELLRAIRQALQNNDYPLAIQCLEEVVDLAHERGDTSAEGRHLGNLALTYYRIGQHAKALEYFEHALDRARNNNDRMTENGLLGNMGNILREINRYDDAIKYLNDALLIAQELGDIRGRGIWLSNLGLVYDDMKAYDEAAPLHAKSVAIAQQLYDRVSTATRTANLGMSQLRLGLEIQAALTLQDAIKIFSELARKDEVAKYSALVGDIYSSMGRNSSKEQPAQRLFQAALEQYSRALNLYSELSDESGAIGVMESLGLLLADMKQYEVATKYLKLAKEGFALTGKKKAAKRVANTLSQLQTYITKQASES